MKQVLAAVACCLWAVSCSTLPRAVTTGNAPRPAAGSARSFHVVCHGWHTGIIVPAADLDRRVPGLARHFHGRRHYEVGWGDAGFYQARDVTPGLATQAMFASPGTVVHVVAFDPPPARFFPYSSVRTVAVSADGYDRMLEYLGSSFVRDASGRIIARGPGLYGESRFFSGVGRYHLFNTCNKWTAKALQSAGLGIHPATTLRAAAVMDAVDRNSGR